ncbi:MAG: response regulator [Betaproteobacteria bacterium]
MSEARVILVDDHVIVRAGLRALLDRLEGIRVVAEAPDGATALELVRRDPPELVITDISMKQMDGVQLAASLKREFPQVRVIVLSMHAGADYVQQALGSGVSAYLLKDSAMVELELAVRAVLRGESYLSPAVSRQVMDGYVEATAPHAELTQRQREILKLIAEGSSAKEIAFQLGISPKTVEAHRAQIMERLQISDVAGLVMYALRTGLIQLKP